MGLRTYIIRRLLLLIPILLGATLLIFAITQLFDPVARASLYITNTNQFTPENIESVIATYGLNDPAYMQFSRWLQQVLGGNLGYSRTARQPVVQTILSRFPTTAEVTMFSAPIIILLGIWLGVKSAVHKDKTIDHITRTISIIGWSLPSFWLGILLIAIFSVGLGWTPTPGRWSAAAQNYISGGQSTFIRYTGMNTIDGILNGQLWISIDAIYHLILPIIVLTTISIALIIRIMRSSMLEALNKGYIVAARSKGLSNNEVINKHARKNALIPTITLSGLMVAGMLNGLVITETIFGLNGLGQWAANAALNLDIAGVLGFTVFAGALFVFANLIVDILYAYLDPRIRLE
jgi:peptide/nickel transport system permease protein